MYLIVGLGNPGAEYENTRHNVGFMVVEQLAQLHRARLDRKTRLSRWSITKISQEEAVLLEPLTYMNNSGLAVKEVLRDKEIGPDRVIVIYDDLDLEPGRIRIRFNGGSGGHNGIKSIISQTGNENFVRVRIGIGRPAGRQNPADYVLSPFKKHELEDIGFAITKAADAVEYIIANGVEKAMNEFNRRADT